ncbi:LysR family transcriptional regulator [Balneatrix alpica]|uniref:LysR family transcriptional regulator n=1 Tax=Balneatrix alpica TaxID=75684 RepID=A0ABV5Z7J7_9GAMM|nr:LysR family transcriptional regulator [Balneatrix alpica]
MQLAALRAFVVAAREQSFSQAAELLHLTQPGLSKRIQVLETELNVSLFDRVGRKTLLTEAGRLFLPHAQRMLEQAEQAQQELKALQQGIGGSLHLATTQHIGLYYLKPLLAEFAKAYPQVELAVDFKKSAEAHQQLLTGELELAFITDPPLHEHNLCYQPLFSERLCFCVSPAHPLAQQSHLSLSDLSHYPALLPGNHTHLRRALESLFNEHHVALQLRQPSNYLEALKMLTEVGLGWSLLAEAMLGPELVRLPLQQYEINRTIVAAWHKKVRLSGAATRLLQQIRQARATDPGVQTDSD